MLRHVTAMASAPPSGPDSPDPPYTGWHVFFTTLLKTCANPDRLEVKAFDKLGDLLLEADAIVVRKVDPHLAPFRYPDLDFLVPLLRLYTVLEYKSPQDRLTWDDFDQGRVYGLLCKRKYRRTWDGEIAVIFLASAVAGDFYEVSAKNGFPFEPVKQGIRRCLVQGPGPAEGIVYYVINLMELGREYPESLLNLLSARRRLYKLPQAGDERGAMAQDLFYATLSREMKKMLEPYKGMPGLSEITEDLSELRRQVMAMHTIEERLEGIPPEQLLKGIPPKQRLEGLDAEQRLEGIPPEQLLKGIPPEQRAELLKLLLKELSPK